MLVNVPHPGRVAKARPKNIVLQRLERYLHDEQDEPIELLCSLWGDQKAALTYREIRDAIVAGDFIEALYDEFAQDYSIFIADRFASVWSKALSAGAQAQPIIGRLSSFHFETQNPGVANWINSRSAQFVTLCSEQQKEAIRALLANKVVESHTVDELARLIRPCVGLTAAQSAATVKYYDSVLSALKSEHPRMKADTARKKALTAASRYAEKSHRYRAMTIAQTELATAYNQGADEGIRQAQAEGLLGPMLKVWRTSGDDAVCDMCAALDGTEIGMDDSFAYAGKLLFPEQRLLPPAHPRCACAVEYIESPVFRYA